MEICWIVPTMTINLQRFSKWTKISTMVLFLRNMKYLALSGMDVLEWPNLSQIYLNGNFCSYILFCIFG